MDFKERYYLKRIHVGDFELDQISPSAWGYHSEPKTFPVFITYSENKNQWTVMIRYDDPKHPDFHKAYGDGTFEEAMFVNRKLELAVKMASDYLTIRPLKIS